MSRLVWDETGERKYETGADHGVLYVAKRRVTDPADPYEEGVPWNGLTAVSESGSGGEPSPLWADNIKYLNLISAEECSFSIEAYTYPYEFSECDGSKEIFPGVPGVLVAQQVRRMFGFCYRTVVGNDVKNNEYGSKLHLVYGCYASPSDKSYATTSDSPDAITFSWSVTTTPVTVDGYKPTATLMIDSTRCNPFIFKRLEDILYGSSTLQSHLPLPAEVVSVFQDDYWYLEDSNGNSITDSNGDEIVAIGYLDD